MAVDKDGNPIVENPPSKVEFTPEQQEHINNLFNQRFAKVATKHEQEMKAMSDAIEALKTKTPEPPPVTKPADTPAEEENKRQMKALLDQERANTNNIKNLLDAANTEKAKVVEENKRILKDQAINEAASNLPNGVEFHELKTVKKLVEDDIVFDADSNQWVVKENGVIKQNSSLLPMTLAEYFGQFAAARPYLVKGQVKGGAGSAESGHNQHVGGVGVVKTKADVKTTKDKVDFIAKFGYEAWAKLPTR